MITSSPSPIDFIQKHSLSIRLWHWITYLTLSASLVTVLLGSTLFKTKDNVAMIQEQMQQKGVMVTKDQARAVAHEYSDKMWDAHKIIGFVLSGLFLLRLFIEMGQPTEEKISVKIKKALAFQSNQLAENNEKKHYLLVKRVYILFYSALFVMALTGLGLAFEDAPFLKDIQRPIKSIHGFVQYIIYGFILFHIVGVILAETGKHRGIVSGMISGAKTDE